MKRKLLAASLLLGGVLCLASCGEDEVTTVPSTNNSTIPSTVPSTPTSVPTSEATSEATSTATTPEVDTDIQYQGAQGYLMNDFMDYSQYENTDGYRKVSTASELLDALSDARYTYAHQITDVNTEGFFGSPYIERKNVGNETNWGRATQKGLYVKNSDGTYSKLASDEPFSSYVAGTTYYEDSPLINCTFTQTLESAGTVNVIEITGDIDLGFNKLSDEDKATYSSIVKSFGKSSSESAYTMSSMFKEHGMSQIGIERTNNLLIYSKNGAKLTHGGFKVNYCKNVAIRNIEFDEMWQWEDSANKNTAKVGDMDAFGWAYFKIGYSENIWIDHCTFGKSYDGQIDVANPYYSSMGTAFCAPYEGTGRSNVHISWCNFTAGSDDPEGYLYKMMEEIEADYQAGGKNYLYYNALRDGGLTFEEILYGIAIPQKKAFLLNDSSTEYMYNKNLEVSFANCYIKNIEDRLPKIRSGIVYMSNVLVDNFEYMTYRGKLRSKNAAGLVAGVNSSWKCALVSQGIVCGLNGSIYVDSCEFRGVESLLKNNDSQFANEAKDPTYRMQGGYKIENSVSRLSENSKPVVDSSKMSNATPAGLKTDYFNWHNENNEKPFDALVYSTDELEEVLLNGKYKSGVLTDGTLDFLTSVYK